jgi:hypothetical protein
MPGVSPLVPRVRFGVASLFMTPVVLSSTDFNANRNLKDQGSLQLTSSFLVFHQLLTCLLQDWSDSSCVLAQQQLVDGCH